MESPARVCRHRFFFSSDFSTDPDLSTALWYNEGSVIAASYDAVNFQIDYAHTAGDLNRMVNYDGTRTTSVEGYMKITISNYSGAGGPNGPWIGFDFTNRSNTNHWASFKLVADGTYELFYNNTSGSLSFDNGAGWTGSLGPQEGLVSFDGGTTTAALDVGGSVTVDSGMRGFGVITAGNASVFPTTSFSIDSLYYQDSLTVAAIPEPGMFAFAVVLSALGMAVHRRRR